jgi:hypothetical protein
MYVQCPNCKRRIAKDGQLCVACQKDPTAAKAAGTDAETEAALKALEAVATTENAPTHGLGDKVAVVAKAFGFVQTPGCGCQQRQENLNYVNFNQPVTQVAKDIWNALRVKKAKT